MKCKLVLRYSLILLVFRVMWFESQPDHLKTLKVNTSKGFRGFALTVLQMV
jgi:hypothetical protein